MTSSQKGKKGEEAAADFFRETGYTILARNYRGSTGEIDLVAAKDGQVVFVEVKHWTLYGVESLERGIGQRKQKRIVATSKQYLLEHPEFDDCSIRYDVLFVPGTGRKAHHIQDAFREEG
jgi:putative endonuclease